MQLCEGLTGQTGLAAAIKEALRDACNDGSVTTPEGLAAMLQVRFKPSKLTYSNSG